MKGKKVFLSTALAGALAAASAAHAVDVKVYPGNACDVASGSQAANLSRTTPESVNVGTVVLSVVCPIVRDNHANLNGVSVGVRVRSFNGAALDCGLRSHTALGNIVTSDSNSTTSNVVTTLALDINTSTKNGTYSLFCNLPVVGAVFGYRVSEF